MDLEAALQELEQAADIAPPLGAADLPPPLRYRQILIVIKSKICPVAETIIEKSRGDVADITVTITDLLLAVFGGIHAPVTTVSRQIARIGIKHFCDEPAAILVVETEREA